MKVGRAMSFEVRDGNDVVLTVGLLLDDGGVVVEIGEPDYDYSDELQRAVEITPTLAVRFDDGTVETYTTINDTKITWADYPDGPALSIYRCDDVLVAPVQSEPEGVPDGEKPTELGGAEREGA